MRWRRRTATSWCSACRGIERTSAMRVFPNLYAKIAWSAKSILCDMTVDKCILYAKLWSPRRHDAESRQPPQRPPFPADPRPESGARTAFCGPSACRPSTTAGPEFGVLGKTVLSRPAADLPDPPSGGHLPGLGHRRLGGGAGQCAEPGRRGADGRDRPLRDAVAEDGAAAGSEARIPDLARHCERPACRWPGATASMRR